MIERINKACAFYPCHDINKLEDCTFCYCPKYPCGILSRGGKYIISKNEKIWDCSECTRIHEKKRVDELLDKLK